MRDPSDAPQRKGVPREVVIGVSVLAGWVAAIYAGLVWFMHRGRSR
jgi:hypothetical protein